ncbi:MAG: hypothetical protein WC670_18295 [Pseudolabrys sp.]|jgi:hypothetical protein
MTTQDVDALALTIAKAIEAIPPEWPRVRRTAHAQVLIRDALRSERAARDAMQDAFNAAINFAIDEAEPMVDGGMEFLRDWRMGDTTNWSEFKPLVTKDRPDPDLDRTLSAVNDAINQPGE